MKKLLLMVCLAVLVSGCFHQTPPSDASLIANFEAHKQVFVALQRKICEDGYSVVSMVPGTSRPANMPAAKEESYYALFRKIGVVELRSSKGCRADFGVWGVGLGSSGDYKGYEFRPNGDTQLVRSLDTIKLTDKPASYLRKIEGDWYLYFDHRP